ncbi:MAG TPA: SIS domain-containing protein [Vicinamibacterales bacterium]|jgi:D-sedoheptulose 7-phosphate isomerase|nr:SIS domain-containing protein [Vicinamibacterales bacterium]
MRPIDASEATAVARRTFDETIGLHQRVSAGASPEVAKAAALIVASLASGGKVLAFGNGGSAADAQHLVAELVGRFQRDRGGFAAIALTTDTSVLTSVANDYGFERVFARQVEALGRAGDVAVAISTSGESPNVAAGVDAAHTRDMQVVALTGRNGGRVGARADVHLNVPHASAARVQEVHRTLIHAICEIVEMAGGEDGR